MNADQAAGEREAERQQRAPERRARERHAERQEPEGGAEDVIGERQVFEVRERASRQLARRS
jgi:hypothetical protein